MFILKRQPVNGSHCPYFKIEWQEKSGDWRGKIKTKKDLREPIRKHSGQFDLGRVVVIHQIFAQPIWPVTIRLVLAPAQTAARTHGAPGVADQQYSFYI